jgi:hypothetical protein
LKIKSKDRKQEFQISLRPISGRVEINASTSFFGKSQFDFKFSPIVRYRKDSTDEEEEEEESESDLDIPDEEPPTKKFRKDEDDPAPPRSFSLGSTINI